MAFDQHHPPARELINDCVHCGFCLPACPTYVLGGQEMDSPRGRILLMDAALNEQIDLNRTVVQHWDSCLGCMACVTACPSGVQYGRLIEQTRQQVERRYRRPVGQRGLRAAIFALLPHHRRMRALGVLLTGYRASGVQRLAHRSGVLSRLPAVLQSAEMLAPPLRMATLRTGAPRRLDPVSGRPRMRVAMLTGCVQRAFFGEVNAATARVLSSWGCAVLAPPAQGCCGALELHAGREKAALKRARALISVLERTGADRIAVNSAGCGSVMKEYGDLLADDPAWASRAADFAGRVRDVSEILVELGRPLATLHPLPMRIAYHDACHLSHAQGITAEPRAVLAAIPGLEVVTASESALCCGSAGVYNLIEPGVAAELGRRKAERIRAVRPDAVAAANPGCLLQIGGWLARDGVPLPMFHPVELLDASLRGRTASRLLLERRRLSAGRTTPPIGCGDDVPSDHARG